MHILQGGMGGGGGVELKALVFSDSVTPDLTGPRNLYTGIVLNFGLACNAKEMLSSLRPTLRTIYEPKEYIV